MKKKEKSYIYIIIIHIRELYFNKYWKILKYLDR